MKEQNNIIHILLIDDDADDRLFFQQALQRVGHQAVFDWASNGEAGLDKLTSALFLPDYVFLDLNMPRLNGLQVLKRIKENEAIKAVPVVICSTAEHPPDRAQLETLGALTYITKPTRMQEMVNILSQVLDGGGGR